MEKRGLNATDIDWEPVSEVPEEYGDVHSQDFENLEDHHHHRGGDEDQLPTTSKHQGHYGAVPPVQPQRRYPVGYNEDEDLINPKLEPNEEPDHDQVMRESKYFNNLFKVDKGPRRQNLELSIKQKSTEELLDECQNFQKIISSGNALLLSQVDVVDMDRINKTFDEVKMRLKNQLEMAKREKEAEARRAAEAQRAMEAREAAAARRAMEVKEAERRAVEARKAMEAEEEAERRAAEALRSKAGVSSQDGVRYGGGNGRISPGKYDGLAPPQTIAPDHLRPAGGPRQPSRPIHKQAVNYEAYFAVLSKHLGVAIARTLLEEHEKGISSIYKDSDAIAAWMIGLGYHGVHWTEEIFVALEDKIVNGEIEPMRIVDGLLKSYGLDWPPKVPRALKRD